MLDFVQFINDNSVLTPAQKLALLNDFCAAHGYAGVDKADFVNQEITLFIRSTINSYREDEARAAAIWDEFDLA